MTKENIAIMGRMNTGGIESNHRIWLFQVQIIERTRKGISGGGVALTLKRV